MPQLCALVKTYEQRNERFFRFWAPLYDGIEWFVGGFRKKVVAIADVKPGDRVLDVACGTGSLSFELEHAGAHVTGVDISRHMLRIARKKLERKKKKRALNLTFVEHDARHLPFEDGSFDVATISFALHDMPHDVQVAVLKEMKRVVKPTGRLVLAEYRIPKNRIGRLLSHAFIRSYETHYYRKFKKQNLLETLAEAGLAVKEEKRIVNGMGRIIRT